MKLSPQNSVEGLELHDRTIAVRGPTQEALLSGRFPLPVIGGFKCSDNIYINIKIRLRGNAVGIGSQQTRAIVALQRNNPTDFNDIIFFSF